MGEAMMDRSASDDTKPAPSVIKRFLDRDARFFRGAVWALVLSLPVWIGLALLFLL
jgi:hypothetical protein